MRQNGRHSADSIFEWISMNENLCILIPISLKFVPNGPILKVIIYNYSNSSFIQIQAWRRLGDKQLSEKLWQNFMYASLDFEEIKRIGDSFCCRFCVWDHGFESCIQQKKTTSLLPIRISLACARASKLTKINTVSYTQGWSNVHWLIASELAQKQKFSIVW